MVQSASSSDGRCSPRAFDFRREMAEIQADMVTSMELTDEVPGIRAALKVVTLEGVTLECAWSVQNGI